LPTRKKATSPDYYWVDFWKELADWLGPTDPDYDGFRRLFLGREDMKLLDLTVFCAAPQPTYNQPVFNDFFSDNWRTEYKNAVYAKVFYDHAEEY